MSRRGYSLVEMMVAVAMLGIVASMAAGSLRGPRLVATAEVQRTRARLALDYRAECAMAGVAADRATVDRLQEGIPGLQVDEHIEGDLVTFEARWPGPWRRQEELALSVFRSAP